MISKFHKFVLITLLLVSSRQTHASLLSIGIEPLVGYERAQILLPTEHTTERMFYGARVSVGVLLLSAEAEYTRATNSESLTDPTTMTTKNISDRLKLGLRSTFSLGPALGAFARAGVEASRTRHEETISGATTVTQIPIAYDPYAGGGLTFRMTSQFYLSAGITVVFREFPKMAKNDYQTSLGFTIRLP